MFLTLIVVICTSGGCTEKVVTDRATAMQCVGPFAAQAIPQWMNEQGLLAKGYRLQSYRCEEIKRTPA